MVQTKVEVGKHSQEHRSYLYRRIYREIVRDLSGCCLCRKERKIIPIWVVKNASYLKTNLFFLG